MSHQGPVLVVSPDGRPALSDILCDRFSFLIVDATCERAAAAFVMSASGLLVGWVTYPRLSGWVARHRWRAYLPCDPPEPRTGDPFILARYGRGRGIRQMEVVGQRLRFSILVSVLTMGAGIALYSLVQWAG